jgi:hypothetical protein
MAASAILGSTSFLADSDSEANIPAALGSYTGNSLAFSEAYTELSINTLAGTGIWSISVSIASFVLRGTPLFCWPSLAI